MAREPELSLSLGAHQPDYEEAIRRLQDIGFERRLFGRDPSLWNGDQEAIRNRLGWLSLPQTMAARLDEIRLVAEDVQESGFEKVVLLGMGGSSLAPEVMSGSLPPLPGYPALSLLDTTDPATIAAATSALDPARTLFVVSSKSGTTVETLSLYHYFASRWPPNGENGSRDNFIAITDPGTPLEKLARVQGFRHVFLNDPDVGGRFSALSCFGLAPAALTGIEIPRLLDSAASLDPLTAMQLGAALGALALKGRDKLTLFTSPSLAGFGAWAEQLIAESTGKHNKGIIPVDREPPGPPEVYAHDRVFVHLRMQGEEDDTRLTSLESAGHPVLRITLSDPYDLGAEFFRWEIAVAAAAVLLGINPFDEPNVTESKERTSEILKEAFRGERLPEPQPQAHLDGIAVYLSQAACPHLRSFSSEPDPSFLLDNGLARPGEYYALLAYIPRTPEHDSLLTRARVALRDATTLATSVGYGPRYLHSTGQLFKGGPDAGVFIQIVSDDPEDLDIPGQEYTFGVLKQAQALGDLQALESRGRRVIRLHLEAAGATGKLRRFVERLEATARAPARHRGS